MGQHLLVRSEIFDVIDPSVAAEGDVKMALAVKSTEPVVAGAVQVIKSSAAVLE